MALPPQRHNIQPGSQRTVRAANLDKTLEQFNAEIGSKLAASLMRYHMDFVEPRLQVLELIWGVTLFRWAKKFFAPMFALYRTDLVFVHPEPVVVPAPEVEPVEGEVRYIDRRGVSAAVES